MSTCNQTLKAQGKVYPRTCQKCGLGPCVGDSLLATVPAAGAPPELAYAVMWNYGDNSAYGVVSVHLTKDGADRMVNLLVKHAETKRFSVEPVPLES